MTNTRRLQQNGSAPIWVRAWARDIRWDPSLESGKTGCFSQGGIHLLGSCKRNREQRQPLPEVLEVAYVAADEAGKAQGVGAKMSTNGDSSGPGRPSRADQKLYQSLLKVQISLGLLGFRSRF